MKVNTSVTLEPTDIMDAIRLFLTTKGHNGEAACNFRLVSADERSKDHIIVQMLEIKA